ncbi:MAG: transketolase [Sphaerochaetaceae bacterium]
MISSNETKHMQKVVDIVDQYVDIMFNYRQSGHPGGTRSKIPAFITLLLGGAMRWDIRNPEKRFNDRFVLGAGHTVPMVYATLALFNEALRIKHKETGDKKYSHKDEKKVLYWEDLVEFRRKDMLSVHAEASGKTEFLKFNTGPSGHGTAAAAGMAVALKRAKAENVKVFIIEGEGGLTPGVTHEIANSAWAMALDNLYFLIDWNDYGIDNHKMSQIMYGNPKLWFSSHGWETFFVKEGDNINSLNKTFLKMVTKENKKRVPRMTYFKTLKGRGYLKYDNESHGAVHKMNSPIFWETKKEFVEKYGCQFVNYQKEAPKSEKEIAKEFMANLEVVTNVLANDKELVNYLADRLVELGESVPLTIEGSCFSDKESPFDDPQIYDYKNYPQDLFAKIGTKVPNRAALGKWGSWINYYGYKNYNRPLFLVSSADLAGSTNIGGFGDGYADFSGYGWYERVGTNDGAILPQGITEFANSGIMVGQASVNFSNDPLNKYDGFWGATSTYGSFSYLVYGLLRLYSQMEQDSTVKLGKVIYVAGHSGPETADDSRTHFGIFSPGVTQLFPEGSVINLHPWEYNEVPVLLGEALKQEKPLIVVLHLTRPPIEIPNRKELGMPSHFEAAKGAYIVKDFDEKGEKEGTFYVQGTSAMANIVKILDKIENNIKIVYVTSAYLFSLQNNKYKEKVVSSYDKNNSTIITTSAKKLFGDFTFGEESLKYAMSSDWDDRWRTGGTLDEVIEEAHLSSDWILQGINKFVNRKK